MYSLTSSLHCYSHYNGRGLVKESLNSKTWTGELMASAVPGVPTVSSWHLTASGFLLVYQGASKKLGSLSGSFRVPYNQGIVSNLVFNPVEQGFLPQ